MKNNNSTTTKFFKVFIALFFIQLFSLSSTNAQVTWLGEKLVQPTGISSDGSIIIGNGWLDVNGLSDTTTGHTPPPMMYLENDGANLIQAYRWQNGIVTPLPTLGGAQTEATGISSDGSIIVGMSTNGSLFERSFVWSSGVMRDLDSTGGTYHHATGISSDGSIIVGWMFDENSVMHAYRYKNGVMTDLGTHGGIESKANGISSDGSIIIGDYKTADGKTHAFRWTESGGMTELSELECSATGIVSDGSIIVGMKTEAGITKAFRWTESGGMRDLDSNSGNDWIVCGIVSDGSIIVGMKTEAGRTKAFVWTTENGMSDLNIKYRNLLTEGSEFITASAISSDGHYIIGTGFNASSGNYEGYKLKIYGNPNYYLICTTPADPSIFSPINPVVQDGNSQTITITPPPGQHIDKVYIGTTCNSGNLVSGVLSSYTFSQVQENKSIKVTFAPDATGPDFWWLSGSAIGKGSKAMDVTDNGIVVGQASFNDGSHAVYWDYSHTMPTDLGTLGGSYSLAKKIDIIKNIPFIVGHSSTGTLDDELHGFITDFSLYPQDMQMKDVGKLSGGEYSTVNSLIKSETGRVYLIGKANNSSIWGYAEVYDQNDKTFNGLWPDNTGINSDYENVRDIFKGISTVGNVMVNPGENHAYRWATGPYGGECDMGTVGYYSRAYDFDVGVSNRNSDNESHLGYPRAAWFDGCDNYSLGPLKSTVGFLYKSSVAYGSYSDGIKNLAVGSAEANAKRHATFWEFPSGALPYGANDPTMTNTNVFVSTIQYDITTAALSGASKLLIPNNISLKPKIGNFSKLYVARRISKSGQYVVGWGWNAQHQCIEAFLLKRW